ncbi:hypothetical protein HAX54_003204 [Datura stramonium]|uniref:RAB6-interacting golgin n=1 Tax=Datura stramonium TaxID=4076 RepID=A0ABS8WUH1_DATST|nr:hypothetical protein [Datura stramonium]
MNRNAPNELSINQTVNGVSDGQVSDANNGHERVQQLPQMLFKRHNVAENTPFSDSITRSTLHDKDMEAARKELSIAAGERLSNAMFEEHKKIEKVSSIRQSLSEVKEEIEKLRRKEKDLEVLLEATEKEIEEAKLGV